MAIHQTLLATFSRPTTTACEHSQAIKKECHVESTEHDTHKNGHPT